MDAEESPSISSSMHGSTIHGSTIIILSDYFVLANGVKVSSEEKTFHVLESHLAGGSNQ